MLAPFKISPQVMAVFDRTAIVEYCAKLSAWIAHQPELAAVAQQGTPVWCEETLGLARGWGIVSEDAVSRLARLRLLRGDDWLRAAPAQDILRARREGALKVFQLECLHWGVAHE